MDAGPSDPNLTTRGRPRKKRVRTVTGCLLCRQRRVKCDERRPRCSNCARHPHRVCEYPFDTEGQETDDALVVRSHTPTVGDEPYISVAQIEMLLSHAAAALMEAQRIDADLLQPCSRTALADSLIAKIRRWTDGNVPVPGVWQC
ncbi:hypothetical protein CC85DRAFT_283523 [Cutaneotrichosporon oleaginosum]|uniref:Zn(2)-C6 fungal-type domain-containing protein n=1 Tax=Cutaneotrichosporon oleaginosum TaxID=879819 RepID=A0A0J0XU51_9TREE|nr:uncharacterized protein CC85DRAFT_283523 [Cutaneotrichosporon oleaginosum]KLT44590.1 hypothetical protein CC85DRAFT_283523 [Cutaneotrichosporon oleaginosum]TXT13895.1 hypothetical protein COLE_00088 [Cutaneotrichosporon oleaginosum]